MRKFLAMLAIAVTLFGISTFAQTAPPSPEPKVAMYIKTNVGNKDEIGVAYVAAVTKIFSSLEGVEVKDGPAPTDAESTAEIHLLTYNEVGAKDPTSIVSFIILWHVQGHATPLYLGFLSGPLIKTNVERMAEEAAQEIMLTLIDFANSSESSEPTAPSTIAPKPENGLSKG